MLSYILMRSLPEGSWMKACAGQVPEDRILVDECWDLILRDMIFYNKTSFDRECEVAIEWLSYGSKRRWETLFSRFLTDINKFTEDMTCIFLGRRDLLPTLQAQSSRDTCDSRRIVALSHLEVF